MRCSNRTLPEPMRKTGKPGKPSPPTKRFWISSSIPDRVARSRRHEELRKVLANSIVAGNATALDPDIGFSGNARFTGNGKSIIGVLDSGMRLSGERTLASEGVMLPQLLNPNPDFNGGLTRTHALPSGSPAVDTGENAAATDTDGTPLTRDQRGLRYPRILGNRVDVGALEFDTRPPTQLVIESTPNPSAFGEPVTVTVRATPDATGTILLEGFGRLPLVGPPGNHTATMSIASLPGGANTLRAAFDGTDSIGPAEASLVHTVQSQNVRFYTVRDKVSELADDRAVIRIRRDETIGDLAVHLFVDATSTASPTDYILRGASGEIVGDEFSLTIPDGATEVEFTMQPTEDFLAEPAETVRIIATPSADYFFAAGSTKVLTINANGLLVTNTNDDGEGSLRQAIRNANDFGDIDSTISFSDALGVPFSSDPQTIGIRSGLMQLRKPITIEGPLAPGHVTLDADYTSCLMWVTPPGATIRNLTIARGTNTSNTSLAGGITFSGFGNLVTTLENVTVRDCRNNGAGGILAVGLGAARCVDCTVSGNQSRGWEGGGVEAQSTVGITMINCTVSGNRNLAGGGAGIGLKRGKIRLVNVTLTDNVSEQIGIGVENGGAAIGGVRGDVEKTEIEIVNSLVAGNYFADGTPSEVFGTFVSQGFNLIGNADGATGFVPSDQTGTTSNPLDPGLLPLADNGGTTLTHSLRPDSIAINRGGIAEGEMPSVDQRGEGYARVAGGVIDIGALEMQSILTLASVAGSIAETDADAEFNLILLRAGDSSQPLEIDWMLEGIDPHPADAEDLSEGRITGKISLAAGATQANLAIQVAGDNRAEETESVAIRLSTLSPDVGFDPSTAGATLTILDDDFAPEAYEDGPFEVVEDGVLAVVDPVTGVLGNDMDRDDPAGNLRAVLVAPPGHSGAFALEPDGTFSYSPAKDYLGEDSFNYFVTDGANASPVTVARLSVVPRVDLTVTIEESRDPVLAGVGLPGNLRHTVTVENHGPSDATALVLVIDKNGEPSTLTVPFLAENATRSIALDFDIDAAFPGGSTIVSTANIQSLDQPVINPEDDSASESTRVVAANAVERVALEPHPILALQTGLYVHRLTITNHNADPIPAFRVYIGGLPAGASVYNASGGLAESRPYVELALPPGSGAAITLSIEIYSPDRNNNLKPDYTIELIENHLPPMVPEGVALVIDRVIRLPDGTVLLEWRSTPGESFHVKYSDGGQEWTVVRPSIHASATRLQWLDRGPPSTSPHPDQSSQRYYCVEREN